MRRSRLTRVIGIAMLGTMAQVGCSLQGIGEDITMILRANAVTVAGDIAQAVAVSLVGNAAN